jgi:di/tricarboxylate transporter
MSAPDDEALWRKRLLSASLLRAMGLAIFLLGLAIGYTDLMREGGWPQVGAIVAILGVIDALLSPRLLKKAWELQDREKR